MLVQGHQGALDAEMRQQLAAGAGVLGGDAVDRGQHFAGARRQVAEVADGGGDDVQGAGPDAVTGVRFGRGDVIRGGGGHVIL